MTVAALYVELRGVYSNVEGVELWDASRDARRYAGPWPVVAHPPCERWGRYWFGGPSAAERRELGDDGGCFAAALASVRRWGGVLEHPAHSYAWAAHGLAAPHAEGWWSADFVGGWTCQVEQGWYGHRARKPTWLYVAGLALGELVPLRWGPAPSTVRLDSGFHTAEERKRWKQRHESQRHAVERMGKAERLRTPIAFRDLLLSIACRVGELKKICEPPKTDDSDGS